jgi:hypothetical protein
MCTLASTFESANEVEKAKDILERAYMERSEVVGPDDAHLQAITLQLCRMLAVEGEHDRMLEYLEVAMDGTKWLFDNHPDPQVPCKLDNTCSELWFSVVGWSFKCLSYLPVDHVQRRAVYARTFQMAKECLKACIRDAPKPHVTSSGAGGMVAFYLLTMFDEELIPTDIDFDYEELLRLLSELDDLYRSYLDHYPSSRVRLLLLSPLRFVNDDMATIYECVRSRILEGRISSSSIDLEFFKTILARMSDCSKNIESI